MLFPWPRTLERPTELRTQACAPIVSTPVRSNPTAVRRFFSANSLPAIRSFPNIRGFPFSPAKATGRRRPAAEPSLSLAATLRVPRERVCQSANSRLAPQLCTLQPFDPGSSDQMRQRKAVPSSPAGQDDAGIGLFGSGVVAETGVKVGAPALAAASSDSLYFGALMYP